MKVASLDEDFTTLHDLAWLETVAKHNEIVFLGETHDSRAIHHLAQRVLFALNDYDHYGLISLEHPYSRGAFYGHYLALGNEAQADHYLRETVRSMVRSEETLELLRAIRRWNSKHPDRRVTVACHDIEHDWRAALDLVLLPYLSAHNPGSAPVDVSGMDFEDLPGVVESIAEQLDRIPRWFVPTGNPVLTHRLASGTLANLRSLWLAKQLPTTFHYYRQRAIIRNLTDKRFLGAAIRRSKALIWGGADHAGLGAELPDGGGFLQEGTFLAQSFPRTKGRVHSIAVEAYALTFEDFATVDMRGCDASGAVELVRRFQAALELGLVQRDHAYSMFGPLDPFEETIVSLMLEEGWEAMRLDGVDWQSLLAAAGSGPLRERLKQHRRKKSIHDEVIVIVRSPVVRPICAHP